MAAELGMRTFLSLHRPVMWKRSFGLVPVQLTSTFLHRRICSSSTNSEEPTPQVKTENDSLLENLNLLGVDVTRARQRQPGVLRRAFTNERGLSRFLQGKGANPQVIADIISRYPRAITRSIEHLDQRWALWKNICKTDEKIVSIVNRSPESFFRSSDNVSLENNITFLTSLGLNTKALYQLLNAAPRTLSNSLDLNREKVEVLEDIFAELGVNNPQQLAKDVICINVYILTRSTKRVKTNVDIVRSVLKLSDLELASLLQGRGAEVLCISSEYLMKNLDNLQKNNDSLGFQETDMKQLVFRYPMVFSIIPNRLNSRLDCLLKEGITMKQIFKNPCFLKLSMQNMTWRLRELQKVGYDFQKNGLTGLDCSRKRFVDKLKKMNSDD